MQNYLHLYGMLVTYTRWVHHGEAVNINVIDYVEAADHQLDLPDALAEEEEEVVVAEPVSLTNIETMLRNARAFRELSPAEEKRWARMLEQCNVDWGLVTEFIQLLHGQSTSDFGPPYSALIKFMKFSTPSTYAAENLRAKVIQVLSIC